MNILQMVQATVTVTHRVFDYYKIVYPLLNHVVTYDS